MLPALLAALALATVTICVIYINNKSDFIEEALDVATQVVREQDIIEKRPEPVTEIKKYGGIAYDFENINPIKTK